MKFVPLFAAALAVALAGPATAAPITYDEAVDGDLAESASDFFTLGVGTNTFTGSIRRTSASSGLGPSSSDQDRFQFNLAAGTRLTGITTAVLAYNEDTSLGGRTDVTLQKSVQESVSGALAFPPLVVQNIDLLLGMPQTLTSLSDPRAVGVFPFETTDEFYLFSAGMSGLLAGPVLFAETDYRVTFEVEAIPVSDVPLPAGAFFLIGGLGALAALRHRRRHA